MPVLCFEYNNACVVCGCRLQGITVGTYRVNKASLVAARGMLTAVIGKCPECCHENGRTWPERWRPTADAADLIAAAREKRGWAA